MGLATLGGHAFRLDPRVVSWDFSIIAVDTPTIGGKVVQVLGATLGDMTVTGSFGVGGWQEQERFLQTMKDMADSQFSKAGGKVGLSEPLIFRYPPKGWDFLVYLTGYKQPGGVGSVLLDDSVHAPEWQLTLFLVEDNAGLTKVAIDTYIARLAEGIGWKQTVYNGPMNFSDVEATLQGRTFEQYVSEQLGISPVQTSSSTGGAGSPRAI